MCQKHLCDQYHQGIHNALKAEDQRVYELLNQEFTRQNSTIQLIAAENQCSRAVLAALGSVIQNKTTEGFIGQRYHGGCQFVDELEQLAIDRAKEVFKAQYANVQPHSGTQANQIVMSAILEKDDRVLCLGLDQGGHVSHGASVSFAGKFYNIESYFVDPETFLLDYDKIAEQAHKFQPKLIICGATAYARTIDFPRFREIADSVGAYLMADISHTSGLVMGQAHPSPVDYAHFTTTSTYKPGGPRGGLILMGPDWDTQTAVNGKTTQLWKLIQKTTFPGVQGTPYLNNIAAKAVFFREALEQPFQNRQFRVIENAKRLADNMKKRGYDVLTGGTNCHMVLIDITNSRPGVTGIIAQNALQQCGIVINMNKLPYDKQNATVTSGIRLGTPIVTRNGMGVTEMDKIAEIIDMCLGAVQIKSQSDFELNKEIAWKVQTQVNELMEHYSFKEF